MAVKKLKKKRFEMTPMSWGLFSASAVLGILSLIFRLNDEDPGTDEGVTWYSKEGATPWTLVVDYEGAQIGFNMKNYG